MSAARQLRRRALPAGESAVSDGYAAQNPAPVSSPAGVPRIARRPRHPHMLRRTRIVGAMRLILPVSAALLLATLALWSRFGFDTNSFRLAMGALGMASVDALAMANAHFEGIDDKKRPFTLSAERATQADKHADIIDLAAPQADITLEDGAWLSLTADSGRYRRQAQLLDLDGQVNLFHDQGYELHTRDVHIDLAKGSAASGNAVDGQGPAGELTAQGMEVTNGGNRIHFLGLSHMTLYNANQSSAAETRP